MIESLSAPGMAVDIRLSTLEPVQQLGARLAQVLSGELSRLRADATFAAAAGVVVHAPEAQLESLRAQQSSVLGHQMIELRTRPSSLGADAGSMLRDVEVERRRRNAEQEEKSTSDKDDQERHPEADEQHQEAQHSINIGNAMLVSALNRALRQCREIAAENGLSGSPLAVALPAGNWLERHAPANIRQQAGNNASAASGGISDLLILCLAYDGSLGSSRAAVGLLFLADRCVGSLHGQWTCEQPAPGNDSDICKMQMKSAEAVSVVDAVCGSAEHDGFSCTGLRVRIESSVREPEHWFCNMSDWTWH